MRIARFRRDGTTSWGFVDGDAVAPVGAGAPSLIEALSLTLAGLEDLAGAAGTAVPLDQVQLLAPIPSPPQFIGVGLNYRDHAAESGLAVPEVPVTFLLHPTSVIDPGATVELPGFTDKVDWEVELAIVIGRGGRDLSRSDALDAVAGYTIVNDISARDIQMSEGQWSRAKSFDTFKPMGPWITTVDELGAAGELDVRLWVNDVIKQESNTRELIFDVPTIVSRLSESTTLLPGAVISTGTPAGVGFARKPPEYVRPGDTMTLEIEGIGRLTNPAAAG